MSNMELVTEIKNNGLVDANQALLEYPADETIDRDDSLAWLEAGVCAQTDPEAFFPKSGNGAIDAKLICTVCTVGARCLQYVLKNENKKERFGIQAGYGARERQDLVKKYGQDIDNETAERLYQEQRAIILQRAFEIDTVRINRAERNKPKPTVT